MNIIPANCLDTGIPANHLIAIMQAVCAGGDYPPVAGVLHPAMPRRAPPCPGVPRRVSTVSACLATHTFKDTVCSWLATMQALPTVSFTAWTVTAGCTLVGFNFNPSTQAPRIIPGQIPYQSV